MTECQMNKNRTLAHQSPKGQNDSSLKSKSIKNVWVLLAIEVAIELNYIILKEAQLKPSRTTLDVTLRNYWFEELNSEIKQGIKYCMNRALPYYYLKGLLYKIEMIEGL